MPAPTDIEGSSRVSALWRTDRMAVLYSLLVSAVYTLVWWGQAPVFGLDTPGYRIAARALTDGAAVVPDRVPGYPALLLLTGSVGTESRITFVVQVLIYLATVLLVLDTSKRLGVGKRLRFALVVVLFLPPMASQMLFLQPEVLSQLLVVVAVWSFTRWVDAARRADLIACGVAVGLSAWVRPTFTLWFAAAAAVAGAAAWSRGRRAAARAAVSVGGTAFLIVALLIVSNIVRFGYPSTTPLLAWHMSTRTSSFIERMNGPDSVRDVLVAERDLNLVEGSTHTGTMYIWAVREELEEVTGLSGRDLDQYMLRMNLQLIAENPQSYLSAVATAAGSYTLMYSPPQADLGLAPLRLVWLAVHGILVAVFAIQFCVTAGLAVLGRIRRSVLWPLVFAYVVVAYNFAVSVLTEVGFARHRLPTDAVVILAMGVGLAQWASVRGEAKRPTG